MPTECERLIAETLRLDGEATKGPWTVDTKSGMSFIDEIDGGQGRSTVFDDDDGRNGTNNAALIASYRTSAPRLARMLQMQIELALYVARGVRPAWLDVALASEFSYRVDEECVAEYVLAEIEKIAKGES